jgi:hypothetical protein
MAPMKEWSIGAMGPNASKRDKEKNLFHVQSDMGAKQ